MCCLATRPILLPPSMTASLRSIVRLVPCRLRRAVLDLGVRRSGSPDEKLLKETHFLLTAQQHLKELNLRYFPQSGMTDQEMIAATAARVGFQMPKQVTPPDADAVPPSGPKGTVA